MIPRLAKFPLRTNFFVFRSHAKQSTAPHLRLLSSPTPSITGARLAVIVPKRLSKLATTRNWLKRLTYDTLWPLIKDRQFDRVVVYKPLPLKKSPATKQEIISELSSFSFENLTRLQ